MGMALIIPSASEKTVLDFLLGVTVPGNQTLGLYVNNYTPDDTTVLANLTEMSTLSYAAKTLTKTSWVTVAGSTGQPATSTYAVQTWTFTAGTPVSVYGYFIKDVTSGLLLWVEAFASAKVVQNNGDQIIITPTITLSRS
jgi:hypothetical protein